MNNQKFNNLLRLNIVFSTLIVLLFNFSSCSNPYKKLAKIEHKHPLQFTEYISKRFEPVTKIVEVTKLLKGKDSIRIDTVTVDIDSLYNVWSKNKPKGKIQLPCPPCVIPRDTILKMRELEKVNKASAELCELKLAEVNKLLEQKNSEFIAQKNKLSSKNRWLAICIAIIAILVVSLFKFR